MPVSVAHSVNYIPLLNGLKVLSHPLQFARAFVTAASFVLQATSFIALRLPGAWKYSFEIKTLMHWASLTPFISVAFSPPSANFSARLRVARASSKRSQAAWRQIIYYFACASFCLVLSGAWHKSKPLRDLYLFRHAGNIGRPRVRTSHSRASHPRSTRRTARRTSDCKPFIRSVQLSAIAG